MEAIQTFATSTLPQSQRLRYWNELAERIYAGTYINGDHSFHGRMQTWRLGELQMIRPAGGPSQVGRRHRTPGSSNIILHLQTRGRCRHRQGRGQDDIVLEPGDFVLSSAATGYEMDLEAHELLVVEFPGAPILQRCEALDSVLSRRIRATSLAGGRVLIDFLQSLWRQAGNAQFPIPGDASWQGAMANVFYDMLGLTLHESRLPRPAADASPPLARQLLRHVETHLGDPDLRTGSIAQALGVSPRTVQNGFATLGTTPSAHILNARLERAADRLTSDHATSITEIAFELGFNDSAYFARCFRRRYDASPREWRKRG
ncbi:helix-turn-helix domain-containing protein [Novosphingobium decolorationis]|uniref:Helix-turn-helix domain-containing protein n=1 Tax=Novosphingobium decolorationis TaxID=2698673 RepID=A0ABX8E5V2_9SPHN|nr:helix-turn-helix domain-containing protein [Novosphingobium decolorationis]QVM84567.1 helix-turn-helix domain-containing protein [Novosphingobium decolorationis]